MLSLLEKHLDYIDVKMLILVTVLFKVKYLSNKSSIFNASLIWELYTPTVVSPIAATIIADDYYLESWSHVYVARTAEFRFLSVH